MALFPLVMVVVAIAFLAFGAGRFGADAQKAPRTNVVATQADSETASASEEAAAAAVVAISLARVAPPLPEEALEPPKAKSPQAGAATSTAAPDAARKPAPRRDAAHPAASQSTAAPAAPPAGASAQAGKTDAGAADQAATKREEPGVLERIGSYAPSPRRIVSAVSDGVSKIASYIPGL